MRKIDTIVVHYSATYEDLDLGVGDMRKVHLVRGFNDVGYHFVIRLGGTVELGRPIEKRGAHVKGHNTGSIGICCIGGLKRGKGNNKGFDTRTPAQKRALAKLIASLLEDYPGSRVVGHRDLTATQCPAFDVGAWWAKEGVRLAVRGPTKPTPQHEVPEWIKTLYGYLRGDLKNG